MPRESRTYRKRSRSRSPRRRSLERRRSRSRDRSRRSRSKDRSRRSRSRERRRSRSRDRKRSRSRDRDRRRSRSRERRRSRSRSRERPKRIREQSPEKSKRSRSKSPKVKIPRQVNIEGAILVKDEPLDKEAEQKRLEQEMQKRRDRIETWRSERKQTLEDVPLQIPPINSKMWTLEDDDDDDDDGINGSNEIEEDEVDPLDAYMQAVHNEVKSTKNPGAANKPALATDGSVKDSKEKGKVTIISAMATKKPDQVKIKGELMEGNIDAMEYSSEDEEENLDDTMAKLIKKKKELVVVDHNRIYYRPYRKEFYVEVPEIARMSPEEVIAFREENEGIKIRGKNCPKPIKTWAQAGVSRKVLECLKRNNFEKPSPIQCQAIPCIMSGRDVIGIAKTGSGKTLAFLLPMFRHIADQDELDEDDGPIAVILTPTRELATQIGKECRKFTKSLGLTVVTVYGGTGISEQISELKRGTEIIVCTPGRMIDMLAANSGRVTNLRRCTYVVLDEADRMFDMGFEPQVMRIMDNIRPNRQTVMFSATFPRQMEALARRILQKPVEVQVGGRSVVCKEVEQHVVVLDEDKKFLKLLELLGLYQERGSVLVFVDKQEHADDVMKDLMKHSYPCMSLHGGIDQYDRDSVIMDFKAGNIKMLIATSIAARGLDVKDLILVINYDCPNHYEDYVHRCGRTGRAGNLGFAYTFLTPDQGKYSHEILKALEMSGASVPTELTKLWEEYKKQAELEGRKIRSFSGFLGKGFKFDETEAHLADERKKIQKAALGLQDSDDDDAGMDIDQKIEDMFASRKRVTNVAKLLISDTGTSTSNHVGVPPAPITVQSNKDKLAEAQKIALQLPLFKKPGAKDVTQQAAAAIMKGGITTPLVSSKTIAEQMAEKINAKLNYRPPQEEEKEAEPATETFKRYEEELDINDFPQTARWKVTSKEALAQICEYSEAGITVRGTYVQPNKEAKEGERPLYLAIEATNEIAIQKAKKEITRLIKDELVRLQNSYQPINKGKYKVLSDSRGMKK